MKNERAPHLGTNELVAPLAPGETALQAMRKAARDYQGQTTRWTCREGDPRYGRMTVAGGFSF